MMSHPLRETYTSPSYVGSWANSTFLSYTHDFNVFFAASRKGPALLGLGTPPPKSDDVGFVARAKIQGEAF